MSTHSGGGGARNPTQGVRERSRPTSAGIIVSRAAGVDDEFRALVGRRLSDTTAARLFAGEPGGTVRLTRLASGGIGYFTNNYDVKTGDAIAYQNGYLTRDATGAPHLYIWNAHVEPGNRGGGIGTRLFARQAKTASSVHVPTIALHAARNDSKGVTGYKFWPRMGFTAPLSDDARASLPANLRGAFTIQDLMRTPAGTAWWDQHGDNLDMTFETARSSRSMQVLRARLAANGQTWASV